jgi:AraC family transcriptional regulator, transcriptional activator of pobA
VVISGRSLGRTATTHPVYALEQAPGVPAIGVRRLDRRSIEGVEPGHAHSHDFVLLAYFERGGGKLRVDDRRWEVRAGDLYVVAPGEVVGVGDDPAELAMAEGWGMYFAPEGLGPAAPDALLAWRTHPLLFPFARGTAAGLQHLRVPAAGRRSWAGRLSALERELRERRDGYREAAVAHLTLLLVDVARLAVDVAGDFRLNGEPLLAEVFDVIEARYREPISLKDVASALALTPGHLTTTVRLKTGRTVQEWITERRLAQARRMLVETDLSVAEVAQAVGYSDPAYFARAFGRAHGMPPLRWRRAGRA